MILITVSSTETISLVPGRRYLQVPNTAPASHPSTQAVAVQDETGNSLYSILDPTGSIYAAIAGAVSA